MRNNKQIKGLLYLLLCLALTGCGSSRENAESTGEIETADMAEGAETGDDEKAGEDSSTAQDTYRMLAKANIALQRQKAQLTLEYDYYYRMVLDRSAQFFDNKDIAPGLSDIEENKMETENIPVKYPEFDVDYQEDISIPEIEESELEERIEELQTENEQLTTEISGLIEQISIYKMQCGYE